MNTKHKLALAAVLALALAVLVLVLAADVAEAGSRGPRRSPLKVTCEGYAVVYIPPKGDWPIYVYPWTTWKPGQTEATIDFTYAGKHRHGTIHKPAECGTSMGYALVAGAVFGAAAGLP